MKKILVTDVARINTFPIYGMVTSLISNNEEYMQWIYNNFIQLRYLVNDHVLMFEQYRSILFSCPYISTEVIDCKTVEEEYSSYVEFAKKCILQEGYLFIYCDRYYISEFWNNRQHDIHELFVVGFCDEQNTFYCWDNASDGKYKQFEVSYNEFEEAMKNRGVDKKYFSNAYIIKKEQWWTNDAIDGRQIKGLMKEYYESTYRRNIIEPFRAVNYGFNTHYDVLNDLWKMARKSASPDIRAICLLEEHKGLMQERFEYMNIKYDNSAYLELSLGYKFLHSKYQLIKYAFLKNKVSGSEKDWGKLCENYESLVEAEKELLDKEVPKMLLVREES